MGTFFPMGGKYYFWHIFLFNQSGDGSDYDTEFTIIVVVILSMINDDKLSIFSVVNRIINRKGL